MRGKVAKKVRKLLFALQVQKKVEGATEYRQHNKSRMIRAFGARSVYLGMKRAYKARRGFVTQPPKTMPRVAKEAWRRVAVRRRKQRARTRRRLETRHNREIWQARRRDEEVWTCPCHYMNIGPLCTKCGLFKEVAM